MWVWVWVWEVRVCVTVIRMAMTVHVRVIGGRVQLLVFPQMQVTVNMLLAGRHAPMGSSRHRHQANSQQRTDHKRCGQQKQEASHEYPSQTDAAGVLVAQPSHSGWTLLHANVTAVCGELQAPDGTVLATSAHLPGEHLRGELRWLAGDLDSGEVAR